MVVSFLFYIFVSHLIREIIFLISANMKKIENSIENVVHFSRLFVAKCLSARAANSNHKSMLYDEDKWDIQFSIFDTSVPLVYDVKGIVSAFYENASDIIDVDYGWGCTTIYLSEGEPKEKVDIEGLSMYLPFGMLEKIFK